MKKIILLMVFAVIILSTAAHAQSVSIAKGPDVRLSFVNQDPDPAEPGRYVDIRIKVENNGSIQAENLIVEFMQDYPFSLDPGVDPQDNRGGLPARQLGKNAIVIRYKVRVDENAVEGENEAYFRYKFDGSDWIEIDPYIIDIRTHDAIISVDAVNVAKEVLEPGLSSNVGIKISNKADSALEDIKVSLDLGGQPFIPIGSTNEQSIYRMKEGEAHTFNFKILANPEALAGVYQIPLKIEYSDEVGKRYFKNSTIGLIINSKPDLSVTLDGTGVYESGNGGEIVTKVVNKGVTDLKFMNMKLLTGDGYMILSNNEAYLGNIDSDDFETADFDIYVQGTKDNQITLPIELEYKDANNKYYKENHRLILPLYSSKEAKKLGLKEGGGPFGIIIAIILAGIVFWYYRRSKKNKKKA
jgi:hypothetical protein